GHARDELDHQLLDHRGGDGAERGHRLGDFLDLVLVQALPQAGVVLAQREEDDRGLFRAGQLPDIVHGGLLGDHARSHQPSCTQLRRMEVDSSGCFSTKSATFLTEEAFTWPSMRAMSSRCSISDGPAGPVSWAICPPDAAIRLVCSGVTGT